MERERLHIVCCDRNRAICGTGVKTHGWASRDDESDECGACVHVDRAGEPCGALFCRLRQAWRNWKCR